MIRCLITRKILKLHRQTTVTYLQKLCEKHIERVHSIIFTVTTAGSVTNFLWRLITSILKPEYSKINPLDPQSVSFEPSNDELL